MTDKTTSGGVDRPSIYDAFATDEELVTKGREFEVPVVGDHVAVFTCLPTDIDLNPEVREPIVEFGLKLRMEHGRGPTQEQLRPIILATVCVAWSGVFDDDGEAIPCTHDRRYELFAKLPKLAARLNRHTDDWHMYKRDAVAAIAGN